MDLKFTPSLSAEEVAQAIDRVERRIRDEHPEVRFIFIEAESLTGRRAAGEAPS
jgi:divalent metal cation (Fe/Co/Zn/Cd) transporter